MRIGALVLALLLVFHVGACHRAKMNSLSITGQNFSSSSSAPAAKKPDFESEIKPIFQARCQPCHFQGGQVYDKMPFDRRETINRLGTKLFTRIKDEKERQIIREFLAQR
jgi:hypothetical protein